MFIKCPLCLAPDQAKKVEGADSRRYYLCRNCFLIFVDSDHYITEQEEKDRYATHDNRIENQGYVKFLTRLLRPLLPYLNENMLGLDYGCGPGPTLSRLVKQEGMDCEDYDPFFVFNPLDKSYDFILATECFEHFRRPDEEIQRVRSLLKPGGLLGLMTERWTSLEGFRKWYYTRDPTHVSFYHATTFKYICKRRRFKILWQDEERVVILRRET